MPARKVVSTSDSAGRKRSLRLHGTIAQDIGVRIVTGQLPPGHVLDGEIEASARLRVSRTAYREAVRILAAKGLVVSRPKLGTRVSEPDRWQLLDPDVLGWMFTTSPDETVLNSLFELRTIVESAACALAATRPCARSRACLRRYRRTQSQGCHWGHDRSHQAGTVGYGSPAPETNSDPGERAALSALARLTRARRSP